MTFGTEWGFGSEEPVCRQIFNEYVDAGGNFVDTADGYSNGHSEEMIGRFVADRRLRDRLVIATKFTFSADPANPNAGGNGRKNIYRALQGSLRRLRTDYVDLYWVHAWDRVTPAEELVSTMNDLVRGGGIRHYGFSNVPAWFLTYAHSFAKFSALEPPVALQFEYSLVERNVEREHLPAAQSFGLGLCPWSPLASGFLTGKYRRTEQGAQGDGRLEKVRGSGNPTFEKGTERNWKILDVLLEVATELGRKPAEVALRWVTKRPGVTSTIIGATNAKQLADNMAALDFELPAEASARLTKASEPELIYPYIFLAPPFTGLINGIAPVKRWERDPEDGAC